MRQQWAHGAPAASKGPKESTCAGQNDVSSNTSAVGMTERRNRRLVQRSLRLSGKKSEFGVNAMMRERTAKDAGEQLFRDLVIPYAVPSEIPADVTDDAKRQRELDYLLMDVVAGGLTAAVLPQGDEFQMCLQSPSGTELYVRPISVADFKRIAAGETGQATFDGIDMRNLTEFWAVRVSRDDLSSSCITRVPTEGMPDMRARSNAVLGQHLTSTDSLAQYLSFLMADSSWSLQAQLRSARRARASRGAAERGKPLLETLLHALVRQPRILDDVEVLLGSLDDASQNWLSDQEFQQLWAAVHAAKLRLAGATS